MESMDDFRAGLRADMEAVREGLQQDKLAGRLLARDVEIYRSGKRETGDQAFHDSRVDFHRDVKDADEDAEVRETEVETYDRDRRNDNDGKGKY